MLYEYGAKVEDGKIIVNDELGQEVITIKTCRNIKLFVNDIRVNDGIKFPVSSKDEIRYTADIIEPRKEMDLIISRDKLEARLKVKYKNGFTYKLADKKMTPSLSLRTEPAEINTIEKFTVDDVRKLLKQEGIEYGIDENAIKKALSGTDEAGTIVARGTEVLHDEPTRLELLINVEGKKVTYDENKSVDYRKMIALPSVCSGDVVANVIKRIEGHDGKDVYGNVIKRKVIKDPKMLIGEGCEIKDDMVLAVNSGMPTFKTNILSINNTLNLQGVNISTGDVDFSGNVEINGRVESGSKIKCKEILKVNGAIDNSKVVSNGNVFVSGPIVNSVVLAGAYDIEKTEYLNVLEKFFEYISSLTENSKILFDKLKGKSLGEVIEFLLEQRYRDINKLSLKVITYNIKFGITDSYLLHFIRTKLINMGALNITAISELEEFKDNLASEVDELKSNNVIKLDCNVNYLQNSTVKSTGDIIIEGMGSYQSIVCALDNIKFVNNQAICIGGEIESKNGNIKLTKAGSLGFIETKVICNNKDSIIEADMAYEGVIFEIANHIYRVKNNCKDVKVYIKDEKIVCDCVEL